MKKMTFLRASAIVILILILGVGMKVNASYLLSLYLPIFVDLSKEPTSLITLSPSNETQKPTNTLEPTTTPTSTTSLEVRILGGFDDAEESESGGINLNSKDIELVYSGSNQTVGMRFNQVEIPKGAIIIRSYLQFKVDEVSSENTILNIKAEATDNAQVFSTQYKDISSRLQTTANIEWEPGAWHTVGEVGPSQRTPDLSELIEEVINRSGWSEGNSLAIIVTGSGKRVAESYNGDPLGAPLLHIEFISDDAQSPTQTGTSSSTLTLVPTASPTETNTFTPTSFPTYTPSPSEQATPTPVPSNTPTATSSPTPTPTPSPSEFATSTPTPSNTPTIISSPSPTPSYPLNNPFEISVIGPDSIGMGFPNPFLVEVEFTFSDPEGRSLVVPGYYDGDGNGGMDGNNWKVKLNPDVLGEWTYVSSSPEPLLDGLTGTFSVIEISPCSHYQNNGMLDFDCVGRLSYNGGHYLKFQNGPYWLKGGEDDPEDFLAPGINAGFSSKDQAIDYLASMGVNSLYLMLNNIGGDGNNVWPWVGTTPSEAQTNQERFDLGKLAEWENLFSYLQKKGIVLHLIFEDDSGWSGFNRTLFYRQMIARFGHHNGLIWNISEEYNENYSANQIKTFAQTIRDIDPYDHPITVHHAGSLDNWLPFVGDNRFDLTSFQTEKSPVNLEAAFWFELVEDSGRIIPISFDETGKIGAADQILTRQIIWSVYMGGANFELHTSPLGSYVDFSTQFSDMTRARQFFDELPFWSMRPMNYLLTSGVGYVFAQVEEVYSVYLPSGGQFEIDLTGITQIFDCKWFNPRDGSSQSIGIVQAGSIIPFTAPTNQDWVLLLKIIKE